MRLGLIVECGPAGAETEALPRLARKCSPGVRIDARDVIPLGDKPNLLADCGKWAQELLRRGCDRVLVVWDLLPAWGEYAGRGCRHEDRQSAFASLTACEVDCGRVKLVCIKAMFEAWLLADERAISKFLSTDAHPLSLPRRRRTESERDPKSALITLFRESRSRKANRYQDVTHARLLVDLLPDTGRLAQCETFRRFQGFVTG